MPDTKNDNKGQKTTTTESKVNSESTKPTTLDDRIAQMDNKSTGAPAFSSIPSSDKKVSDTTTDSPKTEQKPAEAKRPEPEGKKPAPELIPEQKSFEKLPDKPKPEPEPEPQEVVKKSEPVRVMDEGEPEGKNKVLRMFVVGLIVGAILTSIFI